MFRAICSRFQGLVVGATRCAATSCFGDAAAGLRWLYTKLRATHLTSPTILASAGHGTVGQACLLRLSLCTSQPASGSWDEALDDDLVNEIIASALDALPADDAPALPVPSEEWIAERVAGLQACARAPDAEGGLRASSSVR